MSASICRDSNARIRSLTFSVLIGRHCHDVVAAGIGKLFKLAGHAGEKGIGERRQHQTNEP